MSIWAILGIMLVAGLLAAAVVDLRDRKRGGGKAPIPSRAELHGEALSVHNQPTTHSQAFPF